MNKKILIIFSSLCVILAFLLGARIYRSQQEDQLKVQVSQSPEALVRDYAPKLGRDGAAVVVVEFFDPECESCREFYPATKKILADYEGKIQMVFRYAPFHPNSQMVVKILEAARLQQRYWETLELLYEHQPEWGSHHHPRPEMVWELLPKVDGLNVERLKGEMENPTILANLLQDVKDGHTLGVRMTPSFFVNGEPLLEHGEAPLRALIDKHLGNKI